MAEKKKTFKLWKIELDYAEYGAILRTVRGGLACLIGGAAAELAAMSEYSLFAAAAALGLDKYAREKGLYKYIPIIK